MYELLIVFTPLLIGAVGVGLILLTNTNKSKQENEFSITSHTGDLLSYEDISDLKQRHLNNIPWNLQLNLPEPTDIAFSNYDVVIKRAGITYKLRFPSFINILEQYYVDHDIGIPTANTRIYPYAYVHDNSIYITDGYGEPKPMMNVIKNIKDIENINNVWYIRHEIAGRDYLTTPDTWGYNKYWVDKFVKLMQ